MLEMNSYEMLDLANAHVGSSVDDLNRGLALGSAYLMCAFKVGKDLSRLQVSIINVGFLVFVGQAFFGSATEFYMASVWLEEAWSEQANVGLGQTTAWVHRVYGVVCLGAILACMAFMWSVRHSKTE